MGRIILYNHGGSANHGCEALVRTVCGIVNQPERTWICSDTPQEDIHYDVQKLGGLLPSRRSVSRLSPDFWKAYLRLKTAGDYFEMDMLPYRRTIRDFTAKDLVISVGGDIYCYEDYPKYIRLHQLIVRRGCRSVLLGCSMNPELFDDPAFVADMRSYDYISARETLTYDLLKKAGLKNIGYAPDTAFTLQAEYLPLPDKFPEKNTVGINLSPLVERKEPDPGCVLKNYENLIEWILVSTDMNVALIPHVVWKDNDDRIVLNRLYEKYNGNDRIIWIPDCNCMQLKGYVARCRFFIGARTHATIAAYSSCVPTLVVGYSIKSKGIAKDLFETDQHYVLQVSEMKDTDLLTREFRLTYENEEEIRSHLKQVMPGYIERIEIVKSKLNEMLDY